jgi:hypothetical protein
MPSSAAWRVPKTVSSDPQRAPPFVPASERRRVLASDARAGRGAGVSSNGEFTPASAGEEQEYAFSAPSLLRVVQPESAKALRPRSCFVSLGGGEGFIAWSGWRVAGPVGGVYQARIFGAGRLVKSRRKMSVDRHRKNVGRGSWRRSL